MDFLSPGLLLLAITVSVPICTGFTFKNYTTYSGSMWNKNLASFALEKDPLQCYMGGREQESFWKVVLDKPVEVTKVLLSGEYIGSLMVRVGFDHNDLNNRGGHESNLPCRQLDMTGRFNETEFICSKRRVGKVISVNGVTSQPYNLGLCHIDLF